MTVDQILAILRARRKLIGLIFSAVIVLAMALNALLPKSYTASAALLVDVKNSNPLAGDVSAQGLSSGYLTSLLATQVDVIRSDRVAKEAVSLLKLEEDPAFHQAWLDDTDGQGSVSAYLVEQLHRKLDVGIGKEESSVISLSFSARDPKFAADVANAFAQAYVNVTLDLKVAPAKDFANWFSEHSQALRDNLEAAQSRLARYHKEHGIFGTGIQETIRLESARLQELSTQLAMVQAERAESSSRKRQITSRDAVLPEVLQSPLIQSLTAEIAKQEARVQELEGRLGVKHPDLVTAKSELRALRARLETESQQIASALDTSNTVNEAREATLLAAVNAEKKRMLGLETERDQLEVLQKDVESAQRAYDLVIQRFSEKHLESEAEQTNVSILTKAEVPVKPSSPRKLLNLALAVILGGLLAFGIAVGLDLYEPYLRSPEHVVSALGLPVLALLPADDGPAGAPSSGASLPRFETRGGS